MTTPNEVFGEVSRSTVSRDCDRETSFRSYLLLESYNTSVRWEYCKQVITYMSTTQFIGNLHNTMT